MEFKERCPICDQLGPWKSVDEYRFKPSGMHICMNCGFCSYPKTIQDSRALKEFYREEYRVEPTAGNQFTGQKKLFYHGAFLSSVINDWKQKGIEKPVVCEIGAAFGMFLDWIRYNVPGAEIHGTELTKTYIRNAWHRYGIRLEEDFDASRKYDLICSYKVAEHQVDIDKYLRTYVEALKENGQIYISVPCWFGMLSGFGTVGFSLEYYYHPNHINVWTQKLFETLLKKVGLEIVKSNHTYYDHTYLCKRNDDMMAVPREYEKPEEIIDILDRTKKAATLFDQAKYEECISVYPNFPDAHQTLYESKRAENHRLGFEEIYQQSVMKAIRQCPTSASIQCFAGDVCMRYNKWALAIDHFESALAMRPQDTATLMALSHCYRNLAKLEKNPVKSTEILLKARDIMESVMQTSHQGYEEAITWVMHDNSQIPTPWELEAKAKQAG